MDLAAGRVFVRNRRIRIVSLAGLAVFLFSLAIYQWHPQFFPLEEIFRLLPVSIFSFLFAGLIFAFYLVYQNRELRRLRKEVWRKQESLEKTSALLEEVTAFYQSSSVISAHKDDVLLLDLIARESLKCLRAHRSILFFQESANGMPKVGCISATESQYEQVSLEIEKECARRTLSQKKPILLREPREWADLFPSGGKNRGITSLLSVPLIWLGKTFGTLNAALMNEERRFNEKDLEWLMLFSQHASAAIQNIADGGQGNRLGDIELELGKMADSLRRLPVDTLKDTPDRFRSLHTERESEMNEEPSKRATGSLETEGPPSPGRNTPDPAIERANREAVLQAPFGDDSFDFSEDFGDGGLFIRTPNPLELGEKFLLRLHGGRGTDPIEVTCKVIWTNQYGKENKHLSRGMGVKFVNLRSQDREKMKEYIKNSRIAKESPSEARSFG